MALISNDIRSDGILNDSSTKSSLIDHALLLDTVSIRSNISNFYSSLGISASIPHFEKYIRQFIASSSFPITNSVFTFPATGLYGSNILFKSQLIYTIGDLSLAGQGKRCSHLKVRIHLLSGTSWGCDFNTNNNLNITYYDPINKEQFFTAIDPASPFDLHIVFSYSGTFLIEYFEINSTTPTFSKTITVS